MQRNLGLFVLVYVGYLYAEKLEFNCPLPKEPLYGKFVKDGKYLVYICDEGFVRIGSRINYRRCKANGKWSGVDMDCVRSIAESRKCPEPQAPANGIVMVSSREVGGHATYSCKSGYNLKGSSSSTCQSTRTWSGVFPSCYSLQNIKDITNHLKESFIDKMEETSVDSESGLQGKLSVGKSGLDIVFILDTSSSVGPIALEHSKNFTKTIIDIFGVSEHADGGKDGTRVALLTFNDKAKIVFNLDDPNVRSKQSAMKTVDLVQPVGGGTDFNEALGVVSRYVTEKLIDDHSRTRALFFITDSENKSERRARERTMRRANILRNDLNFEIFAIGVGKNVDKFVLADIASTPHLEHVFILSDTEKLKEMTDIIAERDIDYGQCGISGKTETHQSTNDANKNAWPWLGWISVMDREHVHTCGASLLCRGWILTAAQCVSAVDSTGKLRVFAGKDINVHLGEHRLFQPDNTQIMARVHRVLVHPNYSGKMNEYGVRDYDVALLRLHRKTMPHLTKAIRPLCFPTKHRQKNGELYTTARGEFDHMLANQIAVSPGGYIAGWGHRPSLGFDKPSGFLKQITREIQPQTRCLKKYPGLDTSMYFCVYNTFGEKERCEGDIGGPYMYMLASKRYVMLGIALNTSKCYEKNEFSLFLDVLHPNITEWIEGKLKTCNRFEKKKRRKENDAAEEEEEEEEEDDDDDEKGEEEDGNVDKEKNNKKDEKKGKLAKRQTKKKWKKERGRKEKENKKQT